MIDENKITAIVLDHDIGEVMLYTEISVKYIELAYGINSDTLTFPRTDKAGNPKGDCMIWWKNVKRIIEVDKGGSR